MQQDQAQRIHQKEWKKELSQKSLNQAPEDQLVIVDILSIEEIGWIFLYSTKALLATRYVDDELIVNLTIFYGIV